MLVPVPVPVPMAVFDAPSSDKILAKAPSDEIEVAAVVTAGVVASTAKVFVAT